MMVVMSKKTAPDVFPKHGKKLMRADPEAGLRSPFAAENDTLSLLEIHVFFTGYASGPLYNRLSMLFEAYGQDAWEEEEPAHILGADTSGYVSLYNPGSRAVW